MRLFLQNNFGFDIEFVDMTNVENVQKAVKKQTKMIWIETSTNPTMKIIDIQAVCNLAKTHNVITVVDNTFATPYLQSPILLGADIVYNSCTKYLGGHSDVFIGAVFKDNDLHQKVYLSAYSLGANPTPFDCYLMMRGIKTLRLRLYKLLKVLTIQLISCKNYNQLILSSILVQNPILNTNSQKANERIWCNDIFQNQRRKRTSLKIFKGNKNFHIG